MSFVRIVNNYGRLHKLGKQIIKHKKRLTPKTIPYIMDAKKSINIDEPLDLLIAEHLLQNENN